MAIDTKLNVKRVRLDQLRPNPWNPNVMTAALRDKLRKEMEAHGYIVPIIVRPAGKRGGGGTTYEIIDGEQRWDELRQEGIKEVDVVVRDLDDTEARIATVNLNELRGEWDPDGLSRLVQELRTEKSLGELAERLPFTTSDLHRLSVETDGLSSSLVQEMMMTPEIPEAEARRGKVVELGPHRLMCGDATNEDDIKILMDGEKADMVFTDPPYGAAYKTESCPSGRIGAASRTSSRFPGIEGDALPAAEWDSLIGGFLGASKPALVKGGSYYICISTYYAGRLHALVDAAKLHFSTFIIWDKGRGAFGRKDYHSAYEMVLYAWKKGAAHHFYGGRKQTDVWEVVRDDSRNYLHPTQKPVALAARAIDNSSKPDTIVLEPFGGSGSTLIAAEHLGRRCYAMDIMPRNVDLMKERWSRFHRQIHGGGE